MFLLILCLIANPSDNLEKPFRSMAKEIVKNIDSGKIIITNFVNVEGSERRLGVYLAKRFCNYLIEEAKKKKEIVVRDRQWGERLTLDELNYRIAIPAETLLKRLESEVAIYGTYSLHFDKLEIIELKAITTPGATIKSQAQTQVIKLKSEESERLKKYEDEKLPTHISCAELYFLCESGGRDGTIRDIKILSKDRQPINRDSLAIGEYIRVKIELDTTYVYLYVFGWHQGEKAGKDIVTVLYPNEMDPPNPITKRTIILPTDDEYAFIAERPPGYNWIRVIASLEPISELALKGYFEATATQLQRFNNALRNLDKKTWEGRYLDLWIVEE